MSYDLGLCDPTTGEELELDTPHQMRGGTYQIGGCPRAHFNITWNYGRHLQRVLGVDGIRTIYGKTGGESMPILEAAIAILADDVDPDYWEGTEGNTKLALCNLLKLAKMRPEGVWNGD